MLFPQENAGIKFALPKCVVTYVSHKKDNFFSERFPRRSDYFKERSMKKLFSVLAWSWPSPLRSPLSQIRVRSP